MKIIKSPEHAAKIVYAGFAITVLSGLIKDIVDNQVVMLLLMSCGNWLVFLAFQSEKYIKVPKRFLVFFLYGNVVVSCMLIALAVARFVFA